MRDSSINRSLATIIVTGLLLVVPATPALASTGPGPVDLLIRPMDGGNYTPMAPYSAKNTYTGLPGSGTPGDPYVLEGYVINGTSTQDPMFLQSLSKHLLVRNNLFQDSTGHGIEIWDCSNITFEGNVFRNFGAGVYCVRVRDIVFRGNEFYNASHGDYSQSLQLGGNGNVLVEDNDFDTMTIGVSASNIPGLVIRNNTFDNTELPIYVHSNDGATITNNTFGPGVTGYNLELYRSVNCTVGGNAFVGPGMNVRPSAVEDWLTIKIKDDNTIDGDPLISLDGASDRTITGPLSQFFIVNSTNISIEGSSGPSGFFGGAAVHSRHVRVSNGTLAGNRSTLQLHGSDIEVAGMELLGVDIEADGERVSIDDCRFNGTVIAVSITGTNCSVTDCAIGPSTMYAIDVGWGYYFNYRHTRNMTIANNTVTFEASEWAEQQAEGIRIESVSEGLDIRNNSFTGHGIHMPSYYSDTATTWASMTITPDNTVDGSPILYYWGQRGLDISGPAGQLIMANCSHCRVHDLAFEGIHYPLQIALVDNTTFERISVQGARTSIGLYMPTDIEVKRCSFETLWLALNMPVRALVWQNELRGVQLDLLQAKACTVRNNLIVNATNGIYINARSDVTVSHNRIEGCSKEAIHVEGYRYATTVVRVDHNVLVENNKDPKTGATVSPQCGFVDATLAWDDGAEGNYWSDYQDRYPLAGNDGNVWDTPYDVSGGTSDRYPLMEPVDVVAPVAAVDQAGHVVDQGATVSFDASASTDDVGVAAYCWSLEYDGHLHEGSGAVWSFLFDIPGDYVVVLTVRDAEGNWDELEVPVHVRDTEPPVAEAGPDVDVDQGHNATLDGSGSSDNVGIADWNWTLVDNGTEVELHGEYAGWTFVLPGTYRVNLTVTDASGLTGADALNVTVHDTVAPVAEAGEDRTVPLGTNVTLDASGSSDNVGIANCTWGLVYDDAPVDLYGAVVHFEFDILGRYEVELLVADAEGNEATDLVIVYVVDAEPPVAVVDAAIEARTGQAVTLDASRSTDDVGISGYEWTFDYLGEQVNLTGERAQYTFATPGVFVVRLRVTDAAGNAGEATVTVTVRDFSVPTAEAGGDVDVGQGTTVTLDGSASTDDVDVTGWEWTFDQSGTPVKLTGEKAAYNFTAPGVYTVTLRVSDASGNSDTDTLTVTVRDTEPPVAEAGPDLEANEGEPVTLDGSASTDNVGVVRWAWDVRKGIDVIIASPEGERVTLNLSWPWDYDVTLVVYDAAGNEGRDHMTVHILSADAPRAHAGPDVVVDMGAEVTLDGTGTTSARPVRTYQWTFVYGGAEVTRQGATVTFRFDIPGVYNVTLWVNNTRGYVDVDSMVVRVRDTAPPVARIGPVGDIGADRRARLTANGSSDNVGIVNWTWTVRKGGQVVGTMFGREVEYTFPADGKYAVNLTVRDAEGNEASDTEDVDVGGGGGGGGGTSELPVVVVVVAIAAAALVAVLWWRRTRTGR